MVTMAEAQLQAMANEYLRKRGIVYFHLPKGRYNGQKVMAVGGIPDLLIWHQGKHCMIELKTETGTLNAKQLQMFGRFDEAGFPVQICRSFEEFKTAIEVFLGEV